MERDELVDWLAKSACLIERLFTFSFNENESVNNTWLLSNDVDHWSFNFNSNEFSKLLKQCISEKRGPFRVNVNHEKLINCIDTTRNIVNTMYGERIDTGPFDSNFESHSSKQWCPIEFKGEHSPFFVDLSGQIKKHDICHFSSMALIDSLNATTVPQQEKEGAAPMPFQMTTTGSSSSIRNVTMSKSCLACRNDRRGVEIGSFLGEIYHLCNSFNPTLNNVYACRRFEKEFNFATGLDSPMAHHDITMQGHNETLSYFFYGTTTAAAATGGQQVGKKWWNERQEHGFIM